MRFWVYLMGAAVATYSAGAFVGSFQANGEEKIGRIALPFPPPPPITSGPLLRSKNSLSESLSPAAQDNFASINDLCGKSETWQDVELYNGSLGPDRQFVAGLQPHTGQIQWNSDLKKIFSGINDDPGNVEGERWCSGTLIADNLFLTAAHCLATSEDGWKTPRKETSPGHVSLVPPSQLAQLMHVNFNYQVDASTGRLRSPISYKVRSLVEFGFEFPGQKLDYAIVELESGSDGVSPGKRFGIAAMDTSGKMSRTTETLTIIQHPNGAPKKIAAGPFATIDDDYFLYRNLDTLGGSSGSGVYNASGHIVAVHTNGGCDSVGTNRGLALNAIAKRNASKLIK
jgi:V8-like Glu-specific endopeptidase